MLPLAAAANAAEAATLMQQKQQRLCSRSSNANAAAAATLMQQKQQPFLVLSTQRCSIKLNLALHSSRKACKACRAKWQR
jgi:hypothetical protein